MLTAQQQAALYYARKRARQRSEMTAEDGGMRSQHDELGLHMVVTLNVH